MQHFERYFPDIFQAIHRQRPVDAELDEICADHELLVSDLCEITEATSNEIRREQAAVWESLEALAQEIRAKVE